MCTACKTYTFCRLHHPTSGHVAPIILETILEDPPPTFLICDLIYWKTFLKWRLISTNLLLMIFIVVTVLWTFNAASLEMFVMREVLRRHLHIAAVLLRWGGETLGKIEMLKSNSVTLFRENLLQNFVAHPQNPSNKTVRLSLMQENRELPPMFWHEYRLQLVSSSFSWMAYVL